MKAPKQHPTFFCTLNTNSICLLHLVEPHCISANPALKSAIQRAELIARAPPNTKPFERLRGTSANVSAPPVLCSADRVAAALAAFDPWREVTIHKGLPQKTWLFWTPSPPHPQLEKIYRSKFTQPPILCLLLDQPSLPAQGERPLCTVPKDKKKRIPRARSQDKGRRRGQLARSLRGEI